MKKKIGDIVVFILSWLIVGGFLALGIFFSIVSSPFWIPEKIRETL